MRLAWTSLILAVPVLATGCGNQLPPTVKLGGTVTLDAKPLSSGTIQFHPSDKQGAAPVTAPITDGQFAAPVVPVGSYRVSFHTGSTPGLASGTPSGPVDSTFGAPKPEDRTAAKAKDQLPAKYRTPSLPVEAAADNMALKFELTSK